MIQKILLCIVFFFSINSARDWAIYAGASYSSFPIEFSYYDEYSTGNSHTLEWDSRESQGVLTVGFKKKKNLFSVSYGFGLGFDQVNDDTVHFSNGDSLTEKIVLWKMDVFGCYYRELSFSNDFIRLLPGIKAGLDVYSHEPKSSYYNTPPYEDNTSYDEDWKFYKETIISLGGPTAKVLVGFKKVYLSLDADLLFGFRKFSHDNTIDKSFNVNPNLWIGLGFLL